MTAILADNLRPICIAMCSTGTNKSMARQSTHVQNLPRAPHAPELKDSPEAVPELQVLERYHIQLDKYMGSVFLQPVDSHLRTEVVAVVMIDMFVLPPFRTTSNLKNAYEISNVIDWLSSAVSLLRVVLLRLQYEVYPKATNVVLSIKTVLERSMSPSVVADLLYLVKNVYSKLQWTRSHLMNEISERHDAGSLSICGSVVDDSTSLVRKVEILTMNITDILSLISI